MLISSAFFDPARCIMILVVPPSRDGIHGSGMWIQPSEPKILTKLSPLTWTPVVHEARIGPAGVLNLSVAMAYSSQPVAPTCPTAFTSAGSRNVFPIAAPAIQRDIDTG